MRRVRLRSWSALVVFITWWVVGPAGVTAQEPVPTWNGVLADESRSWDGSAQEGWVWASKRPISRDHRWVVFSTSKSKVVADDTNGDTDVFVRDRLTGQVSIVSVTPTGAPGGSSSEPQISADGRHVIFTSCRANLVPNDTNGACDFFARDLAAGRTVRINVGPEEQQALGGPTASAGVSADARYVVFLARFAPNVTRVWLRDRDADEDGEFDEPAPASRTVEIAPVGGPQGDLLSVDISGDGRWISIVAYPGAWVEGQQRLYLYDRISGALTDIDNNVAIGSDLDFEGRYLAYYTRRDVFLYDRTTGTSSRLDQAPLPTENAENNGPSISADGRFVAFGRGTDVFVADRELGTLRMVLPGPNGTSRGGARYVPAISDDGYAVVFTGPGTLLTPPADSQGAFVAVSIDLPREVAAAGEGGSYVVDVRTPPGALWNIRSSAPWLVVDGPQTSTEPAQVGITVLANAWGITRTGVLSVGSETITVTQPTGPTGDRLTPVITWTPPTSVYPTSYLSSAQNASANVPGRFTYAQTSPGVPMPAGVYTLTTTFMPSDLDRYVAVVKTVSWIVQKNRPTISWFPQPATLTYGQPIGPAQMTALPYAPGTVAYSPAPGTILRPGTYTLTATFTTNDPANYENATGTTPLTVIRAKPFIVWTPLPLQEFCDVYCVGAPLGEAQLHAVTNVAGRFEYLPPLGTRVPSGYFRVSARFIPDDTTLYEPVTQRASVNVLPGGRPRKPLAFAAVETLASDGTGGFAAVDMTTQMLSADGRYLAFATDQELMIPGKSARQYEVYVRDRRTRAVTLISRAANGGFANGRSQFPVISGDGRHVAFWSCATNLLASPAQFGTCNVYAHDRATGRTARIGFNQGSVPIGNPLTDVSISNDGRYVVFASRSSTSGPVSAWVHDRDADADGIFDEPPPANVIREVNKVWGTADVATVSISGDGRYVAYVAMSTPSQGTARQRLFLYDRQSGSVTQVDTPACGVPETASTRPSLPDLDGDGATLSYSIDQGSGASEVYVFDRIAGRNTRLSVTHWTDPVASTTGASISDDGRFVSFAALHGLTWEVYGFDRQAGTSYDVREGGSYTWSWKVGARTSISADGLSIALLFDQPFPDGSRERYVLVATNLSLSAEITGTAADGGTLQFDVRAQPDVAWTATSGAGWITVRTPSGTGNGTVTISVQPNPTATWRRGWVAIGSEFINVVQLGPPEIPIVTWDQPAPIAYGTPLAAAQLNATTAVAGTFSYSPAAGTLLEAGVHLLRVTFTPDDTLRYLVSTATTVIEVRRATPVVTWDAPAAITYGIALGSAQLNATATVPGTFSYSPAAGTVLDVGTAQPLTATFTPDDSANYAPSTAAVTLDVARATPTVEWGANSSVYPTPLGPSQLNATATVPGSFAYSPTAGTVLPAGTHMLSATFTPSDEARYLPVTRTTTLTVDKGPVTISWNAAPITYGTPLGANGAIASGSVPGSFEYSPSPGTILPAGTHTVTATFTPSDANYQVTSATGAVTVTKASPVLAWANPANITYGTPLGAGQLKATANVPGSFAYTPAAGTVLSGGSQPLRVTFTPVDSANYDTATAEVAIRVLPVSLSLKANSPSKVYGAPLPAFTVTATGFVNGDTIASLAGALSFVTAATPFSATGTYPVTPGGVSSPSYTITFRTGTLTVNKASTTTTFTSTPSPSLIGATVTLRATITPVAPGNGVPTGTVVFTDGGSTIAAVALVNGVAEFATSFTTRGTHSLVASYGGDGNFKTSSKSRSHKVN